MKLSELIQHVGDKNISLQWLKSSFAGAQVLKQEGKITFATEKLRAQQILNEVAGAKPAECVGIILWVPRDLLPEEVKQFIK